MTKILTQDEIDALLSGAGDPAPSGGTVDPGSVVRYNFRRPDRISKEQINALLFLHDRCARDLSTALSAYLRTMTDFSVVSVEQFTYGEFLASLTDPTAFFALAIPPFEELGALEVNPSVAFAMIDRMIGGAGAGLASQRALTEIEQSILDSVVKLMLQGLAEAWRPVTDLTFKVRARETRPAMLQVAAPNEIVVMAVFDVKIGEARGQVNLCIPTTVVETAGSQFAHAWQRQRRDLTATEAGWRGELLGRVPVALAPLLRTRMKVSEVLALEPGTVVPLPRAADKPLDVYVEGTRKMTGRLASGRGRLKLLVEERCLPGSWGSLGAN